MDLFLVMAAGRRKIGRFLLRWEPLGGLDAVRQEGCYWPEAQLALAQPMVMVMSMAKVWVLTVRLA
jgi:hypothetical protein